MEKEIVCLSKNIEHYYYNCDNISDSGWGCVYRNIQTIYSYLNFYIFDIKIPTINDILLYFKKPINGNGKRMWIEPHQAFLFIKNDLLKNKKNNNVSFFEILYVKNNESINHIEFTPLEIYTESPNLFFTVNEIDNLIKILRKNLQNNIPILIDNGTFSYLIGSINENNYGKIIDPHSTEKAKIYERYLNDWLSRSSCWMILCIK